MRSCWTAYQLRDSTRGLCKVAELRNDFQMFLQILEKHKVAENVDLLGIDLCISAYRTFGWNSLKNFYRDAVNKDVSNPRRQELVAQLLRTAREISDSDVVAWCEEQRGLVLKSLNRSSIPEVEWILDLATSHGVDFMRATLYPQLQAQQLESTFWAHFIRRLKDHPVAKDLGPEFVRECVVQAADNLLVVGQPECAGDSWGYSTENPQKAGLIMEILRLCVETGKIGPCVGIFERMKHATETKTISSTCAPWSATQS
ncbi:hypothetical protein B0H19DRAFT_198207 [Mycena capillaripes]|nr:hypothetical protein B0H19DRAFT_198207 [Mycena capillaripes]